jgi:uncharacterized protein (DUF58 family)
MTPAAPVTLEWRPSAKASCYLVLTVVACVAALVTGRPEAVAIGAPFALALLAGLVAPRPAVRVSASTVRPSATEGEELDVDVRLEVDDGPVWVEVGLRPGPGFAHPDRPPGTRLRRPGPAGLLLERAGQVEHRTALLAARWGRLSPGVAVCRASSRLGAWEAVGEIPVAESVPVYPTPQTLRTLVLPERLVLPSGLHTSRAKGTGYDLAGVRPYYPGDRARDVNWRTSARHGSLFVNERHPERGADVVLLLDTFDPCGVERTVTAACALAEAYLAQRDRVGLVKFGGWLRWLRPGLGSRQHYLVVDALLGTDAAQSAVYRGVDVLPPHTIPPASLLVGLSTLESPSSGASMVELVRRGFDLAVLEVEPPTHRSMLAAPLDGAAMALWRARREANRAGLRRAGAPVVPWAVGQPLAEAFEELAAWTRRGR